jgi:alpha-mannosidase
MSQSFFSRWWRNSDERTHNLVRKLVEQGQLDFVNGGYVQHDEACSHYVAMVDQTTLGHRCVQGRVG